MHDKLRVLMAQINPIVGALSNNTQQIIQIISEQQAHFDIIVFPELAITGYPPEDLIYRPEFLQQVEEQLLFIQKQTQDCYVVLGHPLLHDKHLFNSVSVLHQGECITTYHKQKLPNYEIFDEARYFTAGPQNPCILEINHYRVGICICEDAWHPGPMDDLISQKVDLVLSINASPFDLNKYQRRVNLLKNYAQKGIAIVYVNQVGGQDELLFDGQSMVMDASGEVCVRAAAFNQELCAVEFNGKQPSGNLTPQLPPIQLLYEALVCGTRDYVNKNNFPGVLLGLSGGIDSALTLAIAVDALGAERVQAVLMPSQYTAARSYEDAIAELNALNVNHAQLSIEPAYETLLNTLAPEFTGYAPNIAEENIQARIRGLLLMALSNKTGKMVLTTSNKSEAAMGYATLYGDMCGGFAPLKDVLKTQVYQLANYRNQISQVIPERVITRPPSAELRPNQTDQDSLPDYTVLDEILVAYMEQKITPKELIARGYSADVVSQVLNLLQRNEYKRRQSAPGIKISAVAFGKDWRYPITNGFKPI